MVVVFAVVEVCTVVVEAPAVVVVRDDDERATSMTMLAVFAAISAGICVVLGHVTGLAQG